MMKNKHLHKGYRTYAQKLFASVLYFVFWHFRVMRRDLGVRPTSSGGVFNAGAIWLTT